VDEDGVGPEVDEVDELGLVEVDELGLVEVDELGLVDVLGLVEDGLVDVDGLVVEDGGPATTMVA
jgi:hypothetical protein